MKIINNLSIDQGERGRRKNLTLISTFRSEFFALRFINVPASLSSLLHNPVLRSIENREETRRLTVSPGDRKRKWQDHRVKSRRRWKEGREGKGRSIFTHLLFLLLLLRCRLFVLVNCALSNHDETRLFDVPKLFSCLFLRSLAKHSISTDANQIWSTSKEMSEGMKKNTHKSVRDNWIRPLNGEKFFRRPELNIIGHFKWGERQRSSSSGDLEILLRAKSTCGICRISASLSLCLDDKPKQNSQCLLTCDRYHLIQVNIFKVKRWCKSNERTSSTRYRSDRMVKIIVISLSLSLGRFSPCHAV